jgi:hypothetical protein
MAQEHKHGGRVRFQWQSGIACRVIRKMWAFKRSLGIPLAHIKEIRADSEIAHGWWHGIRMPGTNIPGVLTAGTF